MFASKDSELGHRDTVKIKNDTGKNHQIKMRPYRTPLENREVIDKAIDEILDANVIRRSRPPWYFPVAIVDKKDGSKKIRYRLQKIKSNIKEKFLSFAFDR